MESLTDEEDNNTIDGLLPHEVVSGTSVNVEVDRRQRGQCRHYTETEEDDPNTEKSMRVDQ